MPSLLGSKPNQVSTNGELGTMAFQDASNVLVGNINATGVTTVQAGTASAPAITTTGDTNTGIFFPAADTIAFAEGGAEVARFDSSGNLGIGTTTPAQKLTVTGAGATSVRIQDTNSNTWDITNNSFLSFTRGSTEHMRISNVGDVLVGTTSSFGHFAVSGITGSEGTCVSLREWGNARGSAMNLTAHNTSNADVIYFNTSSTNVGKIAITSSATSYITSSDYRLKENIAPMTDALTKVALLKPCTYTWKSTGESSQGFIAHELAEVVPDCVTGEKDAVNEDGSIKAQGIDTSFLVATLTAALQEAHGLIKDLQARVDVLESK
jgi:hypothetical protein